MFLQEFFSWNSFSFFAAVDIFWYDLQYLPYLVYRYKWRVFHYFLRIIPALSLSEVYLQRKEGGHCSKVYGTLGLLNCHNTCLKYNTDLALVLCFSYNYKFYYI